MNAEIAIVDDDKIQMRSYIQAMLGQGYTTELFLSPGPCLRALRSGKRFKIYLVDIMMPSRGAYCDSETEDGQFTGVLLARDIREIDPDSTIILLTNLNAPGEFDEVQRRIQDMTKVGILRKSEYTPADLAKSVPRILERRLPRKEKSSLVRRLVGSLLLQPNFAGVGIDLKKLGGD